MDNSDGNILHNKLGSIQNLFRKILVLKVIAGKFYKRCQLISLHDKNTYFYLFCYNFAPHVEFWLKLKNGPSPNQNYFIFASIQIIVINRSCHQPTQEIMGRDENVSPETSTVDRQPLTFSGFCTGRRRPLLRFHHAPLGAVYIT